MLAQAFGPHRRLLVPPPLGALGDALAEGLTSKGWIELASDSRDVHVTPAGARGLKKVLGLA